MFSAQTDRTMCAGTSEPLEASRSGGEGKGEGEGKAPTPPPPPPPPVGASVGDASWFGCVGWTTRS